MASNWQGQSWDTSLAPELKHVMPSSTALADYLSRHPTGPEVEGAD